MTDSLNILDDITLPRLELFRPGESELPVRTILFNWYVAGTIRTVDLELWWNRGDSAKERLHGLSIGLVATTDDDFGGKHVVDGRWLTVNGVQLGGSSRLVLGDILSNTKYNLQFTLRSPEGLDIEQAGRQVPQLDFQLEGAIKFWGDDFWGQDFYGRRASRVLKTATPILVEPYVLDTAFVKYLKNRGFDFEGGVTGEEIGFGDPTKASERKR